MTQRYAAGGAAIRSGPEAADPGAHRVAVSVVLPTFNEAPNVRAVIAAVQRVLSDADHEIVVVDDDSPDGTWRLVEALAARDSRIRCLRRIGRRGLASAIVEGMELAEGEALVVMDADLQHDPETIAALVEALGSADVVVASRYVRGGSTGDWGWLRQLASRLATTVGRSLLGVSVADPMSGFFAVRRSTFRAVAGQLRPRGFKVLLEILFRAPEARTAEVPYDFRRRASGHSKLGSRVVFDYLWSVVELRAERALPVRFARYCLVGASGVVVQLAALSALLGVGLRGRWALALAIVAAIISNFALNNGWTFRDRRLRRRAFGGGLLRFGTVSAVGALLNYAVTLLVHDRTGLHLVVCSLLGIAVATLWNFELNRRWTWGSRLDPATDSDALPS